VDLRAGPEKLGGAVNEQDQSGAVFWDYTVGQVDPPRGAPTRVGGRSARSISALYPGRHALYSRMSLRAPAVSLLARG